MYKNFYKLARAGYKMRLKPGQRPTEWRKRCVVTGRPRSVYQQPRLSRIVWKDWIERGWTDLV